MKICFRTILILLCMTCGRMSPVQGQDFSIKSTGTPLMRHYNAEDFGQYVFALDGKQGKDGKVYLATVRGVVQFDGARWRVDASDPFGDFLRAIEDDDQGVKYVITQSYLGCMKPNHLGQLEHHSLMLKIPEEFRESGGYRELTKVNQYVMVRSASHVLRINSVTQEIEGTTVPYGTITAVIHKGQYHVINSQNQLYRWIGDRLELASEFTWEAKDDIQKITSFQDRLVIIDEKGSFWRFDDDGVLSSWPLEVREQIQRDAVRNTLALGNYLAIGTRRSGVLIVDGSGQLIQRIDGSTGILPGAVWGMFQDNNMNLWVLQRKGMTQIQLFSPYTWIDKRHGLNSYAHDMARVGDRIYVATNDGIFFKEDQQPWQTTDGSMPFQHVQGYDQHVRAFQVANEKLMAGNQEGLLSVEGNQVSWIHRGEGLLHGRVAIRDKPFVIFGGTSGRLHLIVWRKERWQYHGPIKGFQGHVDSIWELENGDLWVVDSGTGINRITLNESYDEVLAIRAYGLADGLPDTVNIRVYGLQASQAFLTRQGIYRFDEQQDKFRSDNRFDLIKDLRPIRFTELVDQSIMVFAQKGGKYGYYFLRFEEGAYTLELTPHQELSGLSSNVIGSFGTDQAWIGDNGIVHFDPDQNRHQQATPLTFVSKITAVKDSSVLYFAGHGEPEALRFPYDKSTFRFEFGSSFINYPEKVQYQTKLVGWDQEWSSWANSPTRNFNNLPHGEYQLKGRSRNIYGELSAEALLNFIIATPWYYAWWMYCLYGLVVAGLLRMLLSWNSRRLRRKNDLLELMIAERTQEIRNQATEIQRQKEQAEKAAATIAERNVRIETLFREIHHRVKNNLQLISSLLNTQREWSSTEDPAKAIEDSRSRVVAMSMIHQFLYRKDDIATIDFGEYSEELVSKLDHIQTHRVPYKLALDFDKEYIFDIDTSISLGLILNELVTNSYKHAVKEGRELRLKLVMIEWETDQYELTYLDNGQIMTLSFEEATKKGFGLRLASRLSKQLQGSFSYEYRDGNEFKVRFAGEKARLELID